MKKHHAGEAISKISGSRGSKFMCVRCLCAIFFSGNQEMLVKKYWLVFSDFQDTRPGIKDHIAVAGIFCPSEDRKYIDSIRVHFTLLCTFTGVHLDPVDRNLCV